MSTLLEIANINTTKKAAIDSQSFLAMLTGNSKGKPSRTSTIYNTQRNGFAVRNGKWLYINQNT